MPEMQPSTPSSAALAAAAESATVSGFEDSDFALGCECADPSLQIERWGQEAAGDGA